MGYETITLEKLDRSAVLTFNRPQAMNAMDTTMIIELENCFQELKEAENIQVLLIKGAGPVFSAGGDIKAMVSKDQPFNIDDMMIHLQRMIEAYYTLPMITVAAVHGAAAGLGFSIALGADIIIADEDSKLAMNFIGIGLVPDGGGHFFMAERLGTMKAKQMIWKGEKLTASEAHELGLIDYVADKGQVFALADQQIGQLLSAPILSMIETKQVLHDVKLPVLQNILRAEAGAQTRMRATSDHLEGIEAFVAKRAPKFTGK